MDIPPGLQAIKPDIKALSKAGGRGRIGAHVFQSQLSAFDSWRSPSGVCRIIADYADKMPAAAVKADTANRERKHKGRHG